MALPVMQGNYYVLDSNNLFIFYWETSCVIRQKKGTLWMQLREL